MSIRYTDIPEETLNTMYKDRLESLCLKYELQGKLVISTHVIADGLNISITYKSSGIPNHQVNARATLARLYNCCGAAIVSNMVLIARYANSATWQRSRYLDFYGLLLSVVETVAGWLGYSMLTTTQVDTRKIDAASANGYTPSFSWKNSRTSNTIVHLHKTITSIGVHGSPPGSSGMVGNYELGE